MIYIILAIFVIILIWFIIVSYKRDKIIKEEIRQLIMIKEHMDDNRITPLEALSLMNDIKLNGKKMFNFFNIIV